MPYIGKNPRAALSSAVVVALLALALGVGGCATKGARHPVVLTGNIMVDGPEAIADGPPRDKVLWEYRTAAAAMRRFGTTEPAR